MKKLLLCCLLACMTQAVLAQRSAVDQRYLAGAVPLVNGFVQFDSTYTVAGKSRGELYSALKQYVQSALVNGPEHLPQARITEADSLNGVIAASIEEYLYFKRTAWSTHRVRFYYQLVYQITDGQFSVCMRRLHYMYDPEVSPVGQEADYRAEQWITDKEALSSNGTKLTRVGGKFRRFTIDRKDEIFAASMQAVK